MTLNIENSQTLIISDVHGNYNLLVDFMTKNKIWEVDSNGNCKRLFEGRIIQLGDFFDMSTTSQSKDDELLQKVILDQYYNNGVPLIDEFLVGNHEAFHFGKLKAGQFSGMGNPSSMMEKYIHSSARREERNQFVNVATTVGPYLVTHAGLDSMFQSEFKDEEVTIVANYLNKSYHHARWNMTHNPMIVNIGFASWGPDQVSGVLWFRPSEWSDEFPSLFKQIVGHTPDSYHPKLDTKTNIIHIDNGSIAGVIIQDGDYFFLQ